MNSRILVGLGTGMVSGATIATIVTRQQARRLQHRAARTGMWKALSPEPVVGERQPGPPADLAMLGDAWALGLEVEPERSPGFLLARGMSRAIGAPVSLHTAATPAARTSELSEQMAQLPAPAPRSVAVILTGSVEVAHFASGGVSVVHLARAVRALVRDGWEVVVGTVPDLSASPGLSRPLRILLRRTSRLLAATQLVTADGAGAYTVPLGRSFAADAPARLLRPSLAPSHFGYARLTAALLPSVCRAAESWPPGTPPLHRNIRLRLPRTA